MKENIIRFARIIEAIFSWNKIELLSECCASETMKQRYCQSA